jgi:hypothetical protein
MKIKHLRHKQIDQDRWDAIIANSLNQFGYAYSWYLNIVSPNWEALVSDDYEFIMPLPVKRKFKIPYMVQPDMAQQLGIFSHEVISEIIIKLFIEKIPYYSYQINLNEYNLCSNEGHELIVHPNFVLNLQKNFEQIQSEFSKNTCRNINKAKKAKLSTDFISDPSEYIHFYHSVNTDYNDAAIKILENLIIKGFEQDLMQIPVIRNIDGDIIAGFCILLSGKRMIYLIPASNDEAKKNSAMFLLLNEIIKINSQKDIILDFEGSKVDGIARFYKGFGAENRPYYILKKFRPDFLVGRI